MKRGKLLLLLIIMLIAFSILSESVFSGLFKEEDNSQFVDLISSDKIDFEINIATERQNYYPAYDLIRLYSDKLEVPNNNLYTLTNLDWRNRHGKNYVTNAKNQVTWGPCAVFATIASLETAINLFYNQDVKSDLSEAELYYCKGEDATTLIQEEIVKNGVLDESCLRYDNKKTDIGVYQFCGTKCTDTQDQSWKVNSVILPQEIINYQQIKNYILKFGSAVVGTDIDKRGTHVVTLVGYTEENKHEYFIAKTSIYGNGTIWGQDGFIKLNSLEITTPPIDPFVPPFTPSPRFLRRNPNLTIVCEDNDKDNYCIWGSSRTIPEICPETCKPYQDCDDVNSSIGYCESEIKYLDLDFKTKPGNITLYMDDLLNYKGITPLKNDLLYPGYHVIYFYNPKLPGSRETFDGEIKNYGSLNFFADLTDRNDNTKFVLIESIPNQARVYLNQNYVGETPLYTNLKNLESYNITLESSCYKNKTSRINTQNAENMKNTFLLTPIIGCRQESAIINTGNKDMGGYLFAKLIDGENNDVFRGKIIDENFMRTIKSNSRLELDKIFFNNNKSDIMCPCYDGLTMSYPLKEGRYKLVLGMYSDKDNKKIIKSNMGKELKSEWEIEINR